MQIIIQISSSNNSSSNHKNNRIINNLMNYRHNSNHCRHRPNNSIINNLKSLLKLLNSVLQNLIIKLVFRNLPPLWLFVLLPPPYLLCLPLLSHRLLRLLSPQSLKTRPLNFSFLHQIQFEVPFFSLKLFLSCFFTSLLFFILFHSLFSVCNCLL